MHYPELHYRWEWQLASTPEALWPLVSDTDHFNRATGAPPVEDRAAAGARLPAACEVPARMPASLDAGTLGAGTASRDS